MGETYIQWKNCKEYTGKTFLSNSNEKATVIEYISARKVLIEFEDGTQKYVQATHLRNGGFCNPNKKMISNIGENIIIGNWNQKGITNHPAYRIWYNMILRTNYSKTKSKQPTYIDCQVSEEWKNFQNFINFYDKWYKPTWVLDKDILVKNNKLYSKETCCFVPAKINGLFTFANKLRGKYPLGVSFNSNKYMVSCQIKGIHTNCGRFDTIEEAFQCYKKYKESDIKYWADYYKQELPEHVYKALYNYEILITD